MLQQIVETEQQRDKPKEYTKDDITLLNILRCVPPDLRKFNFFEYGGLTRSILKLLKEVPDLDTIIEQNSDRVVDIPCTAKDNLKDHTIIYTAIPGCRSILANTYNQFSEQSDAKWFIERDIYGPNCETYKASLVALEVYRGASIHPLWEIGLYITKDNNIVYGEEAVLDINTFQPSERMKLLGKLSKFSRGIDIPTEYQNGGVIKKSNEGLPLMEQLILDTNIMKVISEDEFNQRTSDRLRYLTGTNDIKKMFRIEDLAGYNTGFRRYDVELISEHLGSTEGSFSVQTIAGTERDLKNPNARTKQESNYTHKQGIERFLEIGNILLNLMYMNAQKGSKQFDITMDFNYVTTAYDKNNVPVTITVWERPAYLADGRLDHSRKEHYIQIWNCNPKPLILEEGKCFPEKIHFQKPKETDPLIKQMVRTMGEIEYNPDTYLSNAIAEGIPFIPSTNN
jgi:hypothetical protein